LHQAEIGQKLGTMYRDNLFDGLELDDDSLNNEIDLIRRFQGPAAVLHLQGNVPPEFHAP